jgi:hypothetical protein
VTRKGTPREQISAGLRFDVLRRCNFACYYCGTPAALGLKVLHVDHVIPVSLGGTNDPWNLVAACWDCNLGKAGGVPSRELIQRVRDDHYAYLQAAGVEVISCRFCSVPVEIPPDEDMTDHCELCDAVMFYGYDAGAGQPHEWVAP